MKAEAEVFADEVAGEACGEGGLDAADGVEGVTEGFGVAKVGDDDVGVADFGEAWGVEEHVFKGGDVVAVLGADADGLVLVYAGVGIDFFVDGVKFIFVDEVAFVEYADEGLVFAEREDAIFHLVNLNCRIAVVVD